MEDEEAVQESLEHTAQHLRDYKIAVEYKYLIKNAPGGVYIMPELNNIRRLHGVIFLRRGAYRDGVFRFLITLPNDYNSFGSYPQIVFTPPVFNPFIHPKTGLFNLSADENMKEWSPDRHFIITALVFLKKIFYTKSFPDSTKIVNTEAMELLSREDTSEYDRRVKQDVQRSLGQLYQESPTADCTISFTAPKNEINTIRKQIFDVNAAPSV